MVDLPEDETVYPQDLLTRATWYSRDTGEREQAALFNLVLEAFRRGIERGRHIQLTEDEKMNQERIEAILMDFSFSNYGLDEVDFTKDDPGALDWLKDLAKAIASAQQD